MELLASFPDIYSSDDGLASDVEIGATSTQGCSECCEVRAMKLDGSRSGEFAENCRTPDL